MAVVFGRIRAIPPIGLACRTQHESRLAGLSSGYGSCFIPDAVGPCVVSAHRHASASAALQRHLQCMVVLRTVPLESGNLSKVLSVLKPFQRESPALVCVVDCRAWV